MKCEHCGEVRPADCVMLMVSDFKGGKKWYCRDWQQCDARAAYQEDLRKGK